MRIRRLRIRDLKRHARLDLEFAEGLTVVRGPNEAGKSTIQRALEMALFRKSSAAGQEMEQMRRWGAAADAFPTVELEFEHDGSEGRLVKVFAGQRGTGSLELGGERWTDPNAIDRRIGELTGIPGEKFFRATANVRHQELDDLKRDESTVRDRLRMAISGADRGTALARRKLQEAITRYRSEGSKNPGLLKVARAEVTQLEERARGGEEQLRRLTADREALAAARERRRDVERRLAEARERLEASQHAVSLLAEQREAEFRYDRLRRAAELAERIAERERVHPSPIALPILRRSVERVRELDVRVATLERDLAAEAELGADAPPAPAPAAAVPLVAAVLSLLVAVAVVVVGPTFVPVFVARVTAAVLGILAAVLAIVASRRRARAQGVRQEALVSRDAAARRTQGRSQLEHELREAERTRELLLGELGVPDRQLAEQALEAELEHRAGIELLRAELRGLLPEVQAQDEIERLRDEAAAAVAQKRHALAGMGESGADPATNRQRWEATVHRLAQERESILAEETRALTGVEANPVDAEQVAGDAERLELARERLAGLERRMRILQRTLRALDDAEQATMRKAARYLEVHMGTDIARITGGRYDRVEVDEDSLEFRAWSTERDDWTHVRDLSQGTLDQFYLAARLGLVRQITGGKRPPLLLDDPFVTFDDTRAERALELLRAVTADHQVILFTCSTRYDRHADHVVALPPPESHVPPGAEPGPTEARATTTSTAQETGTATETRDGATAPAAPGNEDEGPVQVVLPFLMDQP